MTGKESFAIDSSLFDIPVTRSELWDMLHEVRMILMCQNIAIKSLRTKDDEEYMKQVEESQERIVELTEQMNALIGVTRVEGRK